MPDTTDVYIAGWSHLPFGRHSSRDLESMITEATREALKHSQVDAADIDEIFLSNYNAGLTPQAFPSSLVLQAHPALQMKPATRIENACASGSAAIHQGIRAILAGTADIVLVVGAESMTRVSTADIDRSLLGASYLAEEARLGSFVGVFAEIARAYAGKYRDPSRALAQIAAKNHANGALNPLAHIRKDLGYEFCNTVSDRNPLVAAPLRRTDCSAVSDGAAALILCRREVAASLGRDIRFAAFEHISDFLPMSRRDLTGLAACRLAWQQALQSSGLSVWDLSFIETHDCFTIAELMQYEAMGMSDPGDADLLLEDGTVYFEGRLPINLSGGLKAKGHPIGATGVSMHVMAAMQLAGSAPGLQLHQPTKGGVFNMGGSGVANYVSILQRGD